MMPTTGLVAEMTSGLCIMHGRSSEQCQIDMLKRELAEQKIICQQLKTDHDLLLATVAQAKILLPREGASGFFVKMKNIHKARELLNQRFK